MKIPLFDIDWTLLRGGNTNHEAAFSYAFKNVYNLNASMREIEAEGMIDNQIIMEILKKHNYPFKEAQFKLPQAIEAMKAYFIKHKEEIVSPALPGVIRLLTSLKEKNFIIGVLTGNVDEIGWTKIKKAGIREFIDFGVFGNMAFKRADLVTLALEKLNKDFNQKVTSRDIVIIGDSLRDVKCAKDSNSHCIAVSTGLNSQEELKKAGADLVLSSLEELKKVVDYLQN